MCFVKLGHYMFIWPYMVELWTSWQLHFVLDPPLLQQSVTKLFVIQNFICGWFNTEISSFFAFGLEWSPQTKRIRVRLYVVVALSHLFLNCSRNRTRSRNILWYISIKLNEAGVKPPQDKIGTCNKFIRPAAGRGGAAVSSAALDVGSQWTKGGSAASERFRKNDLRVWHSAVVFWPAANVISQPLRWNVSVVACSVGNHNCVSPGQPGHCSGWGSPEESWCTAQTAGFPSDPGWPWSPGAMLACLTQGNTKWPKGHRLTITLEIITHLDFW